MPGAGPARPRPRATPARSRSWAPRREAARQAGDYDRAVELARRGLEVAAGTGRRLPRRRRGAGPRWPAVAHYRGDFASAARDWARSARAIGPRAAGLLASAALAAGYGGDRAQAATLLDEAREHEATSPNSSNHAFLTYVEGELVAVDDPGGGRPVVRRRDRGGAQRGRHLRGRRGRRRPGLRAGADRRPGRPPPRRTPSCSTTGAPPGTGRSCGPRPATPPRCSLAEGHPREAALLLLRADATPQAAAVDPDIARHSGRSFVPVSTVVGADELEALRAEAAALSASEVVDAARAALQSIAGR